MLAVEQHRSSSANENHYGAVVTDWLSKWYGFITAMQTDRPVEMEGINTETRNGDEQTAVPRGAEARLSSLYSGTASLVLPNPNLINLPVSTRPFTLHNSCHACASPPAWRPLAHTVAPRRGVHLQALANVSLHAGRGQRPAAVEQAA